MKEKIEEYIAECFKLREGTAQKYSLYIHGYVVPTIELQREKGELKKVTDYDFSPDDSPPCKYTGEVISDDDTFHGEGTIKLSDGRIHDTV